MPVFHVGGQRVLLFWLQLITAWREKTYSEGFSCDFSDSTWVPKADSSPTISDHLQIAESVISKDAVKSSQ